MFSPDLVSVYLAVGAVGLAIVATVMLARLRRASAPLAADPEAVTGVASGGSLHDDERDVVAVALVPDPGPAGGRSWRFELADGTPPTRVVIFSFRIRRPDGCGPWQHELVDAPLRLLPGRPTHLPAPPAIGVRFDVSIAWTTDGADGPARGSSFVSLA